MADSFFGFKTSLNEGGELVEEPELDEEEYDALNDETFGADAFEGDWEEDHTRFAEVAENSRVYRNSYNSDKDDDFDLEASISQLVLEGEEENEEDDVESYSRHKTTNSNNITDGLLFDYLSGNSSTWSNNLDNKPSRPVSKSFPSQPQKIQSNQSLAMPSTNFLPPQLPRIPTVQELERDLMLKNKQGKHVDKENKLIDLSHTSLQDKKPLLNVQNNQFPNINAQHNKFTYPTGSNKFPPGFGPLQPRFNQPQQQELVMLRNNQNVPPMQLGPLLLPPHLPMLLSPHILPPPSHPMMLGQNPRVPPPMMRFMPNHPILLQQQQQQQQQHQQQQHHQQQQKQQMQLHQQHQQQLQHQHQQHQQMQTLHQHQQQQQQIMQKQQIHLKQVQNKVQSNQEHMRNGQTSRNYHNNSGHSQHPWLHNPNRRGTGNYDEYAGLMTNRERQWLLNIQIIQLASDKPHVDDYYYMVWSKKQEKEKKLKQETRNGLKPNRESHFGNNRQQKQQEGGKGNEKRDSEREMTVTPSPRVYVPLQFENSLGKLQCGSVTAPRKIIDLDVVPERQVEATPPTNQRDSRKSKKILLELEQLYLLAMDIEDLDNNITGQGSTEEPPLSKPKLLDQIMNSFLNEDRFVNFMCIRKGKTLLLRVLPHLNHSDHFDHLTNLWCRLIKSVSVIIRRDNNDGILLQIYPYFKNWINTVDCTVLSIIASYLLTANISSNSKKSSRAVSPNPGKSVLCYILTTTFGVSVVSSILCRGETIYPTIEEKDKTSWSNFVLSFIKHMTNVPNMDSIPSPLDPLPSNVVTVILNRSTGLHIQDYASVKRVLTAFNKDKSRS